MAYLSGASGPDVDAVAVALEHAQVALPPMVLTELRSDPKVSESVKDLFTHDLPLVTRDADFRHFVRLAGVRLAVGSAND